MWCTRSNRMGVMVEFDVKCRQCGRPITLGVRDEAARAFFESEGALCQACYQPGYRVGARRHATPARPTGRARLIPALSQRGEADSG